MFHSPPGSAPDEPPPPAPALSPAELARHPVTTAVGLAAVAASAAIWLRMWDGAPLAMDFRTWEGELWRPLGSTLPHANLFHLLFNLYWLWQFGTRAERTFGSPAAALLYAHLAFVSSAAQYALDGPGIGLSGIGYGLFGLLAVLTRRDPRFAGAVDGNTFRLFVGWFFLCWVLTALSVWNIANTAHAAGAAFGALIGVALTARGNARVGARVGLVVATVLVVVAGARATPTPVELAYIGWRDLTAGRNAEAAVNLERAVALDPSLADAWTNLAIARSRLGQVDGSIEAYEAAARLRPEDRHIRGGLLAVRGYRKQRGGDTEGAIRDYEEAVAADGTQASYWYCLGTAYRAAGRVVDAGTAFLRGAALDPGNPEYEAAARGAGVGGK